MGKTTFEDLVRTHGEPIRVVHGETRRTGARMSSSTPPPISRYVDHAWWACGLESRITFGGHYQLLKACIEDKHSNREASD